MHSYGPNTIQNNNEMIVYKLVAENMTIVAMTQMPIGKAKIIEVNAEYSICKVISSTEAVRKNDILKRGQ